MDSLKRSLDFLSMKTIFYERTDVHIHCTVNKKGKNIPILVSIFIDNCLNSIVGLNLVLKIVF